MTSALLQLAITLGGLTALAIICAQWYLLFWLLKKARLPRWAAVMLATLLFGILLFIEFLFFMFSFQDALAGR